MSALEKNVSEMQKHDYNGKKLLNNMLCSKDRERINIMIIRNCKNIVLNCLHKKIGLILKTFVRFSTVHLENRQ